MLTPKDPKKTIEGNLGSKSLQGIGSEELVTNLSSEIIEDAQKSLEFENENFKIDSSCWEEEIRVVDGRSQKTKVNPQGDVLEYLELPAKGEQLFITYASFIKYVAQAKGCSVQEAEQKYLLTKEELQVKMKQVDYPEFYNNEIKEHCAGYWDPNINECYEVGYSAEIWLAGRCNATFEQRQWSCGNDCDSFGFSGRLLKN